MLADFHVHSTASDGTVSPSELAKRAAGGGFAAIALTDHDNLDGIPEFLSVPANVVRVAGVELSIEPGAGFDKFHLLGLGVDPSDAGLRSYLARVLDGRNARNARILANFARIGIEIAPADIAAYAHGDVLARPHFANWLVAHGKARDIADAFARYLLPDSPPETRCFEERWHPPQEETFRIVHAAGGIAVMAHPKYWRHGWKTGGPDYAAAGRELARLREMGLDGLESLYAANSASENVEFSRLAKNLGLLVSAGSDFHGENKPAIRLGMSVDAFCLAPLLERLSGTRGFASPRDVI